MTGSGHLSGLPAAARIRVCVLRRRYGTSTSTRRARVGKAWTLGASVKQDITCLVAPPGDEDNLPGTNQYKGVKG